MSNSVQRVSVRRIPGGLEQEDHLVVEEPLELVLAYYDPSNQSGDDQNQCIEKTIAITMRTPGHDDVLAAGFFFTEGVISAPSDIIAISTVDNRTVVSLRSGLVPDLKLLERHFYTNSSCGVCGKTSLEALHAVAPFPVPGAPFICSAEALQALPAELLHRQGAFASTGSAHAAALFNVDGVIESAYEDVGRHNALDKLIGAAFLAGQLPLSKHGILLSGRAGFELVQKTRMAASPMLAAIGAPSGLAVDLAWESGMTLVGFLREQSMNVYSCPSRIIVLTA